MKICFTIKRESNFLFQKQKNIKRFYFFRHLVVTFSCFYFFFFRNVLKNNYKSKKKN